MRLEIFVVLYIASTILTGVFLFAVNPSLSPSSLGEKSFNFFGFFAIIFSLIAQFFHAKKHSKKTKTYGSARNKHIFYIIVLLIVFIIVYISEISQSEENIRYIEFKDPNGLFSFGYPENWKPVNISDYVSSSLLRNDEVSEKVESLSFSVTSPEGTESLTVITYSINEFDARNLTVFREASIEQFLMSGGTIAEKSRIAFDDKELLGYCGKTKNNRHCAYMTACNEIF